MKFVKFLLSTSLLLTLIGCAAVQKPIALDNNIYNENKKIGLVFTETPKATTVYTGSIGLLDYAIISGANEGLDEHLATLTFPEYKEFIENIKTSFSHKGLELVSIDKPISIEEAKELKSPSENKSANDFSAYKTKYNLDMLMLINLRTIGTTRSYYGFIPTSEPLAQAVINGQLIDLSTNELHWFSNGLSQKTIAEPWDESDSGYPNLTTSVYQALDEALQIITYELEGNTPLNIAEKTTK